MKTTANMLTLIVRLSNSDQKNAFRRSPSIIRLAIGIRGLKWAAFLTILSLSGCMAKETSEYKLSVHPRILLLENEEKAIQRSIEDNPILSNMHEAIIAESRVMLETGLLPRVVVGRRLLGTSREVLRRVFYLSYAFRMTGEEAFLERTEKEMLSAAGFSDWNPSHFLDVGEMTMALAIGYDWLFDHLSPESKSIIREAILKKGLEPSFDEKFNWFLRASNNWNQVCNAGLTYGALAIYEDYPEIANEVIDRAFNTIVLSMKDYEPDGAYPEGYGYWNYGTSFNVLWLSAVNKIWPGRFDEDSYKAFGQTGKFTKNMLAPSGKSYNWGDNGPDGSLSPSMFWFAKKNNQPSLLWMERLFLETDSYASFTGNRILPAIMVWGKDVDLSHIQEPDDLAYVADGIIPVAALRTSWSDTNAIFIGFKGGSPTVSHGHMDIGSFILEANGVRWASELGAQNYHSLEALGMNIWRYEQDAERWQVLRLNNFIHNTLTVNNSLQRADGHADIDRYSGNPEFLFAISDISRVYHSQLNSAVRGVAIVDQEYVVIRDEIRSGTEPAVVRWQMLTEAEVTITGNNEALLTKDGQTLYLKIDHPSGATVKTWSSQPTTTYDAPNPGTILVGFETRLEPETAENIQVRLIPGNTAPSALFSKSLHDWQ